MEIISWSISTNVWDRVWIKLMTPDLQSDTYLQSDTLTTALSGAVIKYGKILNKYIIMLRMFVCLF